MKDYDYHILTIDLSALSGEREYNINGGLIQFISGSGEILIRLNSNDSDQIPLTLNKGIQAPFEKFFLSSVATGTIKLYVSSNAEIKFTGNEININNINEVTHITNVDSVDIVTAIGALPFASNGFGGAVTITDINTGIITTGNESSYKSLYIENTGISDVWIRKTSPSSIAGGFCLRAGASIYIPQYNQTLYGICDTGETTKVNLKYFQ